MFYYIFRKTWSNIFSLVTSFSWIILVIDSSRFLIGITQIFIWKQTCSALWMCHITRIDHWVLFWWLNDWSTRVPWHTSKFLFLDLKQIKIVSKWSSPNSPKHWHITRRQFAPRTMINLVAGCLKEMDQSFELYSRTL